MASPQAIVDNLKEVIGDQAVQISILRAEMADLRTALDEANSQITEYQERDLSQVAEAETTG